MQRLIVKENTALERDVDNKAILSTDKKAYRAALAKRAYTQKQKKEINNLNKKVDDLTNLVHKLVEKMDK